MCEYLIDAYHQWGESRKPHNLADSNAADENQAEHINTTEMESGLYRSCNKPLESSFGHLHRRIVAPGLAECLSALHVHVRMQGVVYQRIVFVFCYIIGCQELSPLDALIDLARADNSRRAHIHSLRLFALILFKGRPHQRCVSLLTNRHCSLHRVQPVPACK